MHTVTPSVLQLTVHRKNLSWDTEDSKREQKTHMSRKELGSGAASPCSPFSLMKIKYGSHNLIRCIKMEQS